jgi:hypothetical protein
VQLAAPKSPTARFRFKCHLFRMAASFFCSAPKSDEMQEQVVVRLRIVVPQPALAIREQALGLTTLYPPPLPLRERSLPFTLDHSDYDYQALKTCRERILEVAEERKHVRNTYEHILHRRLLVLARAAARCLISSL